MHSVIVTPTFERHAAQAGLSEDEIMAIVSKIAADPLSGDLIPGAGGARKLRFPRPGKGKSGGYRSVHYFAGEDVPVFLLALIDKGRRADLSMAERNALASILSRLGDDYRAGRAKLKKGRP